MSNNNGKISAPVDIWDPYFVLGAGTPATGYDIGNLIMEKHGEINKWAKYKPVVFANAPFASVEGKTGYVNFSTSAPHWWKAHYGDRGGDCGVRPKDGARGTGTNRLGFAKFVTASAENRSWDYIYPTGGLAAPFRLTDWAKYDHGAQSPFGELPVDLNIYVRGTGPYKLSIAWSETLSGEGALTIQDLSFDYENAKPLSEWYYGVILYQEGNQDRFTFLTAQNPGSRIIEVSNLPEAAFTFADRMIPIMCNKKLTYGENTRTDETYIALPQKNPVIIDDWEAEDDKVDATPMALRDANNPLTVNWKVTFENRTNSAVTFKGNAAGTTQMDLRMATTYGSDVNNVIANSQHLTYLANVTVPANSNKVVTGQSQIPTNIKCLAIIFNVSNSAATFANSAFIMTPLDLGNIGTAPWP